MNLDDAVTFSTISLQDIASSELCWVLEDEEAREPEEREHLNLRIVGIEIKMRL